MLKKIKELLIIETNSDLAEYEKISADIEIVESNLKEIDDELTAVDHEIENIDDQRKASRRVKRYSFIEKRITKRKEYLEDSQKAASYDEKKEEDYEIRREEILKRKKELEEKASKLVSLRPDLEAIKKRTDLIKSANSIKDMKITFTDAMKLLKNEGLQFIMSEEDKKTPNNSTNLTDTKNLVFIHKTAYIPKNNKVLPGYLNGGKKEVTIHMPDGDFQFKYPYARNTVHFCINGEVSSHYEGNFDGRKYAVIVPYETIEKENMCSLREEDTFFDGEVDISHGYILCPKNEVEMISQNNPNVTVIGYEGENVDGYAEAFIRLLGYKSNEIDPSPRTAHYLKGISKANGSIHAASMEAYRDDMVEQYYAIMSLTDSIVKYKNNGFFEDKDPYEFLYNLFDSSDITMVNGKKKGKINEFPVSFCKFIYSSERYKEAYGPKYLEEIITGKKVYFSDHENSSLTFLLNQLKENYGVNITPSIRERYKRTQVFNGLEQVLEEVEDENLRVVANKLIEKGSIFNETSLKDFLIISEITKQVLKQDKKTDSSGIHR